MDKKYYTFAIFLWNPFLRRVLQQKNIVVFCVFLCILGIGVDSFRCYCMRPCAPWNLGLQSIAQISTNKHDSGLPVFQQTSCKLIHNSAHGKLNAASSFRLDNSA